ncbi:hypothetical protein SRABI27_00036 [Pedobacter sp. Bi27]|nr:hypothetical protein SRABI27_00036 [Pedobacter sp. Bi27]
MMNDEECKMGNRQNSAVISDFRGKHDAIEFLQI